MNDIEPMMSDGELASVREFCGKYRDSDPNTTWQRIRRLLGRLDTVTAERDELQALVDKLPRTADGVPLVLTKKLPPSSTPPSHRKAVGDERK